MEFESFDKIPPVSREMIVTEKTDETKFTHHKLIGGRFIVDDPLLSERYLGMLDAAHKYLHDSQPPISFTNHSLDISINQEPPIVCWLIDSSIHIQHEMAKEIVNAMEILTRADELDGIVYWWNRDTDATRFSMWKNISLDLANRLRELDKEWEQNRKEISNEQL